MIPAEQALVRLKDGNLRYVSGKMESPTKLDSSHRKNLIKDQSPYAVILGCSDSRVPVELVFDEAPGELFVIRVAGNIATSTQIGSIEFAVTQLSSNLIVVMGHSGCGAVGATLSEIKNPSGKLTENLQGIINHIKPGVDHVFQENSDKDDLLALAVKANIIATISRIKKASSVLGKKATDGEIMIVGAEYSLHSGKVEFL